MMLILSAPGLEDTESSEEIPGEEIEADAPIIRRGVWGDLWAEPIDPEAIQVQIVVNSFILLLISRITQEVVYWAFVCKLVGNVLSLPN